MLRYATALSVLALAAAVAVAVGPLVAHPPTTTPTPPPELPRLPLPPPPPAVGGAGGSGSPSPMVLWILAGIVTALLLIALIRRLRELLRAPRRIRVDALPQARTGLLPELVGLAEEAAEVDLDYGRHFDQQRSADDIIATWAALETAAGLLGAPRRSADTPTEFLTGCLERWGAPESAASADTLLILYHRARFDTGELGIGAATAARQTARSLLRSWQRSASVGAS